MVLDGRNRSHTTRNARRPRRRREPLQVVSSASERRAEGRAQGTAAPNQASSPRRNLSVVPSRGLASIGRGEAPFNRASAAGRRRAVGSETTSRRSGRAPITSQSLRAQRAANPRKRRSLFSRTPSTPSSSRGLRSPHQVKNAAVASPAGLASTATKSSALRQQPNAELAGRQRRRNSLSRRREPGSRAAVWKKRQQQRQPRPVAPVSPLTYVLRLLIVGVGLGVIAGTVLASIDPSLRYQPTEAETAAMEAAKKPPSTELVLKREMPALTTQLQSLISQNEGLTAGVMVVDLERNSHTSINASRRFASASTIKLPILVALLEEADAGNLSLTESITMEFEDIVGEAGEMQFQPPGTQFSVLETATEMIRISDNTATNLLIKRLGGMTLLNDRFRTWGLKQTALQNMLPDLGGTNTISPKDLVTLLGRVNRGDILSAAGRDRLFQILQTTQTNELLPQGIGPGATIAHKTGNIGKSIGDVGLVQMPSGKNYLMMAMVERPHGDERADELIRNLSWETYQFLESTEQKSEQMVPPNVPRSNIAGSEMELDSSIMTTDP